MIQDQLNGLDFMVMNTRFMGAQIAPHMNGGEFHVFNAGWGKAVNFTVSWDGGEDFIEELGPGEMIVYPTPPADVVTITYRQLVIDAPEAKDRVVVFETTGAAVEAPSADAPLFGVIAAVAVLLAALALARRR